MNAETVAELTKRREALRDASAEKIAGPHAELTDQIDVLQEQLKRRPNRPDAEQLRARVAELKQKRQALHDPGIAELDEAISMARKMARASERNAAVEALLKSAESLSDDALEAEERRLYAEARRAREQAEVLSAELNRRRVYAKATAGARGLSKAERAAQRAALDAADAADAKAKN